jgi:hypothetical protein
MTGYFPRMRVPVLTMACAMAGPLVAAQAPRPPAPIYNTSQPIPGKVVVENEYRFTTRDYTPAVEVKIVARDQASYANPESAAIAGISAMLSQDFEWFRSTWDKPSGAVMEARDREMKQDAAFWTKTWQKAFGGTTVRLISRIDTGPYVLIVYKASSEAGVTAGKPAAGDLELVTVLKADGDKWLATQELSQDPVLVNRKTPDVRSRHVVRY